MSRTEQLAADGRQLADLRRLVGRGEGQTLEFKRKVAFPDKVVRELIAFANTDGGTLLIGVDDDGSIPGVKFPDEECLLLDQEQKRFCRPMLQTSTQTIRLNEKRFVVCVDVARSDRRPHFYVAGGLKMAFVRERDQTFRASLEMVEIVRRLKTLKGMKFPYGDSEQAVIRFLADQPGITLQEFAKLTGLRGASRHPVSSLGWFWPTSFALRPRKGGMFFQECDGLLSRFERFGRYRDPSNHPMKCYLPTCTDIKSCC